MSERDWKPDFSKESTLKGTGRISVKPTSRSLVEAVLEAEGVDPTDFLGPKQLKKLRKTAQRGLPIGTTLPSR